MMVMFRNRSGGTGPENENRTRSRLTDRTRPRSMYVSSEWSAIFSSVQGDVHRSDSVSSSSEASINSDGTSGNFRLTRWLGRRRSRVDGYEAEEERRGELLKALAQRMHGASNDFRPDLPVTVWAHERDSESTDPPPAYTDPYVPLPDYRE